MNKNILWKNKNQYRKIKLLLTKYLIKLKILILKKI